MFFNVGFEIISYSLDVAVTKSASLQEKKKSFCKVAGQAVSTALFTEGLHFGGKMPPRPIATAAVAMSSILKLGTKLFK